MNKHDGKKAVKYVLSCLAKEDHDGKHLTTYKARLFYFLQCFVGEYDWEIRQIGVRLAMTEYLGGLPSTYLGAFYNDDIITLGIKWGYLTDKSSPSKKDKFIKTWFKRTSSIILSAAINNNIIERSDVFLIDDFIAKFK